MMSRLSRLRTIVAESGPTGGLRAVLSYIRWRFRGAPPPPTPIHPPYREWIDHHSGVRPDRHRLRPDIGISIICPIHNTEPKVLEECVESVLRQTHPTWELILVDDASTHGDTIEAAERLRSRDPRIELKRLRANSGIAKATNTGAGIARLEFLLFLDHDDTLEPTALEWVASVAPNADLVYSDEDKIDLDGRRFAQVFKPAWSPRLLLGQNYVNHLTAVRRSTFVDAGGLRLGWDGVQDHDFLLRISESDLRVVHVPNVLYHWRQWQGSTSNRVDASAAAARRSIEESGLRMVGEAIERRGWAARAALGTGVSFQYRVLFDATDPPPLVKIVMPTRDRVRLLRRSIDGVLNRTDEVDVHLVVVDNGSEKRQTLEYLEQIDQAHGNVTVLRIDDAFNYSVLVNAGAATGPESPFLLLLNNDVEILHRPWLRQLTGWLVNDPEVVGAGPLLLFADGRVQHGGVVLGMGGIAGHYARGMPHEPRLGDYHDQAREVAALTAACLLVRTTDFEKVGGFTEQLPTDFGDVDFCLRLRRELGGSLVYDPTYPLIHRESATRSTVVDGYTQARFRFLWSEILAEGDPFYSPHLSLSPVYAKDHVEWTHHPNLLAQLSDDSLGKPLNRRVEPRFAAGSQPDPES